MKVQDYISSGIIEACALGIASERDMLELLEICERYPEVKQIFEGCQMSLENLTELYATEPPEFLKEKIHQTLMSDEFTIAADENAEPKAINRDKHKPNLIYLRYLLAAAVLILVCSIVFNFIFWNRTQTSENKIAQLEQKQESIVKRSENNEASLNHYEETLQLFLNPSVAYIPLSGVGSHSAYSAVALWNAKTKQVYLALQDLPNPPTGKQYQLWAIVDGKPVDAGLYDDKAERTVQEMKKISNAQQFAVTLEKVGGVPSPTLSAMVVAGKI